LESDRASGERNDKALVTQNVLITGKALATPQSYFSKKRRNLSGFAPVVVNPLFRGGEHVRQHSIPKYLPYFHFACGRVAIPPLTQPHWLIIQRESCGTVSFEVRHLKKTRTGLRIKSGSA